MSRTNITKLDLLIHAGKRGARPTVEVLVDAGKFHSSKNFVKSDGWRRSGPPVVSDTIPML